MSDITIKGKSLDEWRDWLSNEIAPPNLLTAEQIYVFEGFIELIDEAKLLKSSMS